MAIRYNISFLTSAATHAENVKLDKTLNVLRNPLRKYEKVWKDAEQLRKSSGNELFVLLAKIIISIIIITIYLLLSFKINVNIDMNWNIHRILTSQLKPFFLISSYMHFATLRIPKLLKLRLKISN